MRAVLLSLLLLGLAPAAGEAVIVPGKSIAGVRIGMERAEVLERLGEPDETNRAQHDIIGRYTELRYGRMYIGFFDSDDTVFTVSTTSKRERTSRNVGVGSSRTTVRRRVPRVKCENVGGFRHCYVGRFTAGEIVMDFILSRENRVKSIRLGRVID